MIVLSKSFSSVFALLIVLFSEANQAEGGHGLKHKPTKLFVFGDSYTDTGNTKKETSGAWKDPYGSTYPGHPSGRWSDGRVWTDYVARYLGLKPPTPYEMRALKTMKLNSGMNFAYSETGVFDTTSSYPNMTVQIDYFHQVFRDGIYTPSDLASSVALLGIAGEDHALFAALNPNASDQEWVAFFEKVANQMIHNVERIQAVGVKTIAINALQPMGCLPALITASLFTKCDNSLNQRTVIQNQLFQKTIAKLAKRTPNTNYVFVDLYSAFLTIVQGSEKNRSKNVFQNTLKPCCVGTSVNSSCGSVDSKGMKQYTVCDNPDGSFFWDMYQPTERGWREVYLRLRSTLALL